MVVLFLRLPNSLPSDLPRWPKSHEIYCLNSTPKTISEGTTPSNVNTVSDSYLLTMPSYENPRQSNLDYNRWPDSKLEKPEGYQEIGG